jgi:hypothetical protein
MGRVPTHIDSTCRCTTWDSRLTSVQASALLGPRRGLDDEGCSFEQGYLILSHFDKTLVYA